jgi:hypothetical protein
MSDQPLQGLSLQELVAKARAGTLASTTLNLERPSPASSTGEGTALFDPTLAQHAPSGSPLAVELIQARDLAELASRLSRSKSDFKQSTGRALLKAISGQLWAPQGHRNQTAYQIAAEIVEAYPNVDAASAVHCFSAAISNANSQGSKMSEAKWAGMLQRVQNERQLRLNMVAQVAPLLSATGRALEAQAKLTTPAAAPLVHTPAQYQEPLPQTVYPSGAVTPVDTLAQVVHSLVILADGVYYLRRPDETHYRWRVKSQQALRVELARQFGVNNQTVISHDEKGSPLPVDELLLLYGSNAHRIVYDYASPATTWDAGSETLQVGFPSEPPDIHPDLAVHDWLSALSGGVATEAGTLADDSAADLYDWISACQRAYIQKPSTALCIVGPPDAGKGVLVRALAKTWGCLPVKLSNAVERFNGSLLNSPVWHADERTPEGLTDDLFRTIVQERERLIEPKGREKVELRGCGRLVFTLNDPSDFQVGSIAGPEALQAVADRVSYFDCRGNAQALALTMKPLMLPDGDMDLERIVRHLRWVQTTYTPRSQRFLGAREDRSKVSDFVVRQMAANYADIYERILEYLLAPQVWEAQYHADRRTFDDGYRYPIVTSAGGLWIWPTEFAARLGVAGKDAGRLRAALKAIRTGAQHEISHGPRGNNVRGNYSEIDLDRLVIAANVIQDSETWRAVIQTVSVETRTRKPD